MQLELSVWTATKVHDVFHVPCARGILRRRMDDGDTHGLNGGAGLARGYLRLRGCNDRTRHLLTLRGELTSSVLVRVAFAHGGDHTRPGSERELA